MQSARKTKMSFCLGIFMHFEVKADALLHTEADHCFVRPMLCLFFVFAS